MADILFEGLGDEGVGVGPVDEVVGGVLGQVADGPPEVGMLGQEVTDGLQVGGGGVGFVDFLG